MVHDITPDEMDMSDSTVSSVPLETNSEDDAPMRGTPNSDAEPSSANPDQDGSQRQDSVTEEVSTTKPAGLTEGNDNTGANSYPLRSLDSPPEVDFAEKEAKRSNNENPGFYSSINQNSGNTMNMNCGNTMQQNCGNTTTNNDSSRNIRVSIWPCATCCLLGYILTDSLRWLDNIKPSSSISTAGSSRRMTRLSNSWCERQQLR